MDGPNIRVDATLLKNFQGRIVRIVGRVQSSNGQYTTLDSNGPVNLITQQGEQLSSNQNYEVIGKIGQDDLNIRVLSHTLLSENINYKALETLINASHKPGASSLYY